MQINIDTLDQYEYYKAICQEPLREWKVFKVKQSLRREIEDRLFGKSLLGKGDVLQANQKYYEYAYQISWKYCEECCIPLFDYSSIYVSHIISRSNNPALAHDLRNHNILCPAHHKAWETNPTGMKIYLKNKIVINLMQNDGRK